MVAQGTFSEGSALNPAAFTGLRTPTIQWTYHLSENRTLLSSYFQQHLLMGAYPMAPIPLNDHSIQPGSLLVDQAYEDYAPLFDAMHGAQWLLATRPVDVQAAGGANLSVNIFTIGDTTQRGSAPLTLIVPVMLGGVALDNSSAVVRLHLAAAITELNWPSLNTANASVLHPGDSSWTEIVCTRGSTSTDWELRVPLKEGC